MLVTECRPLLSLKQAAKGGGGGGVQQAQICLLRKLRFPIFASCFEKRVLKLKETLMRGESWGKVQVLLSQGVLDQPGNTSFLPRNRSKTRVRVMKLGNMNAHLKPSRATVTRCSATEYAT